MAKRFAHYLGLEPVVLYVDSFDELIPQLNAGKGDLIANNLTITEARKQLVDFSTPMTTTRLVLVSRRDQPKVEDGDQLKGKTLVVTEGTTYEQRAREFARQHPGVKVEVLDRNYVDLAIDVAKGSKDFTVIDESILNQVLQFREDLKKNITFPEEQELGWAIRKNSPQLLEQLNEGVRHVKLYRTTERYTGDLDEIKKRGQLRAVTRNTSSTYFMWKGRILGYEYELLRKFAKDQGLRLEIIVAEGHDDFVEFVSNGKADIAASLLSITERRKHQGMAFSSPYFKSRVGVVARKDDAIDSIQELSGRKVHVRRSSSQYDILEKLRHQVPGIEVELVPEEVKISEVIDKVAERDYDLAMVDEISVQLARSWRDDIHFQLDLQTDNYAWMVRNENPQLLAAIDKFFGKDDTAPILTTLKEKYFETPKYTRPEIKKLTAGGHISPYDAIVKKYAEEYDFDWRLVVAQMFQESSFNPRAKSWVGARGLMQVMPDTGKQVGETNLYNPETGVRAGLKYLEWLHEKFINREDIAPDNEMWFTLAAYNAGLGHVYDAKDLAEDKGWDRKVWFGNVEKAMLLLSDKKYYSKARYGFARGQEPVDYVRKIQARFNRYVALLDAHQAQIDAIASFRCGYFPVWLKTWLQECADERLVTDGE
ncbi:transporter substrate-binding domain-containing protein [Microbulbifer taiwanensis]